MNGFLVKAASCNIFQPVQENLRPLWSKRLLAVVLWLTVIAGEGSMCKGEQKRYHTCYRRTCAIICSNKMVSVVVPLGGN